MEYKEFINKKTFRPNNVGFSAVYLNHHLKGFQNAIVKWALKRGRAAVFADTGLGKTLMQLEWAERVADYTNKPVLILAPLAVAKQTTEEAEKFYITPVKYLRDDSGMDDSKIYITNYEMQSNFNPDDFSGIVLDESSILKNQIGRTRIEIIDRWSKVDYRLSCTATPSPNDFVELGNQAEFLGIMKMSEMLSMFFINDTGDTGTWRLKKHGKDKFWEWLSTWSIVVRKPQDIGFDDEGYDLPPLNIIEHVIESGTVQEGELFAKPAQSMSERRAAKKESIEKRINKAAELVNNSDDSWVIWCHLNDEQDAIEKAITADLTSVRGSDSIEKKEDGLLGFTHGKYKNIVSKPSIAGMGLNWQHSNNQIFVGIDDSFEKFYQAVRRQWRFGQTKPVNVHLIITDVEGEVKRNIERKQKQHDEMSEQMVKYMQDMMKKEIHGAGVEKTNYYPSENMRLPAWI